MLFFNKDREARMIDGDEYMAMIEENLFEVGKKT